MLQVGGALPTTPLELLLISSVETKVVLAILLVFSLIAWFIIVLKWWQFRRLHRQGGQFFAELERTTRLQEGYHAAMKQPPSPYNRLFREAINFYSELRPGALKEEVAAHAAHVDPARGAEDGADEGGLGGEGLLEPLHPLAGHRRRGRARCMGLLGTVLGVMDAFIGISSKGSGNISAVAPGVAEALIATVGGPRGGHPGGHRLQPVREPGPACWRGARGLRRRADRDDGARGDGLTWAR